MKIITEVTCFYGLNICVPKNLYVEILMYNVTDLEMWPWALPSLMEFVLL